MRHPHIEEQATGRLDVIEEGVLSAHTEYLDFGKSGVIVRVHGV